MNKPTLPPDLLQILKTGTVERVFRTDDSWAPYYKNLKNSVENKVFCQPCLGLIDELKEMYGVLPDQQTFTKAYAGLGMAETATKDWYNLADEQFLQNCWNWRADRAYISAITEECTAFFLRYMGYDVFQDKFLDTGFGVDMIASKYNKFYQIHVTKDTHYARQKLYVKDSYVIDREIDGNTVRFHRDFTGHVGFYYSEENSNKNIIKHGIPVFELSAMVKWLEYAHAFTADELAPIFERIREAHRYDRHGVQQKILDVLNVEENKEKETVNA